jgi:hypothetical protein
VALASCTHYVAPLAPISTYVGEEHTGELLGTSMLTGIPLESPDFTEYALEYVSTDSGHVLVLQRLLSRNEAGSSRWRVLAARRVPEAPRGYVYMFFSCAQRDRRDANVFALVKPEEGSWWNEVLRAWRVVPERAEFTEIPITGIGCSPPAAAPHSV